MKPLIGITAKLSYDGNIGIITNIGCKDQSWVVLADDYVKSIEQAGGIPIVIPIIENYSRSFEIADKLDGIVLSGGNDIDPKYYDDEREFEYTSLIEKLDEFEINLYKKMFNDSKIPILGICRGLQLINTVHGGSLFQEMRMGEYPKHTYPKEQISKTVLAHGVSITENSLLHKIINEKNIETNSFHHQSIRALGRDLKINAMSEDGIVEGIEAVGDRFILGVQWHPEMLAPDDSINDIHSKRIFKYFIDESVKYKISKDTRWVD